MILSKKQREMVEFFWFTIFMVSNQEKRTAFRKQIREYLKGDIHPVLSVDHDPEGSLLEILRDSGIECRGHMFSASGIFPAKTTTWCEPNGGVSFKIGYGAYTDTVFDIERLKELLSKR